LVIITSLTSTLHAAMESGAMALFGLSYLRVRQRQNKICQSAFGYCLSLSRKR
jgi:hypothetical protein